VEPQPQFQPEVMERFAALLEQRARNFARGFTIAGGVIGGAVGLLPLTPAGEIWPIPHVMGFTTLVLGAAAGSVVGYAASKHRAGMLRLQAQTTLCQLYSQRTSFALWLLLKNHGVEPAAAVETATSPEDVVEPAPAPEPEPAVALEPEHTPEPEPEHTPEPEPGPPLFEPTPAPVPFAPAFALATATPEPAPPAAPLAPPPLLLPPLTHGFPPVTPQAPPEEPPVTAPSPLLGSPMLGSPLVVPSVSSAQSVEQWPGEAKLEGSPPLSPPLSPTHFVD
jgi:hypothetical protein